MPNWSKSVAQARRIDLPYLWRGQVTQRATKVYTQGDCWHLAHEITRRTGWVIYYAEAPEHGVSDWAYHHAMVRMPNGLLLDVRGPQNMQQAIDRWGVLHVDEVARQVIEERLSGAPEPFRRRTEAVALNLLADVSVLV